MNKRRLLKLADLLEADAKNRKGIKFDLSVWGEVGDADEPLSCGTTACAMGLAALSGSFMRAGLQHRISCGILEIGFNGDWDSIRAAQELFDISREDAKDLFVHYSRLKTTSGAAGERAVAKRIRDFVAGKGAY